MSSSEDLASVLEEREAALLACAEKLQVTLDPLERDYLQKYQHTLAMTVFELRNRCAHAARKRGMQRRHRTRTTPPRKRIVSPVKSLNAGATALPAHMSPTLERVRVVQLRKAENKKHMENERRERYEKKSLALSQRLEDRKRKIDADMERRMKDSAKNYSERLLRRFNASKDSPKPPRRRAQRRK